MVNYGPTVLATKAAILLFLVRVFAPYKSYVNGIYGFLGLMTVYYVVMLILKCMICRPISMFWGATTEGQCFNQRLLILIDNVISLISDVVVLLLPCPLTKQLQVGRMAQVKIAAVFGIGGIACIFSLVRLVFIINDGQSADQTYTFVKINLTGYAIFMGLASVLRRCVHVQQLLANLLQYSRGWHRHRMCVFASHACSLEVNLPQGKA